MIIRTRNLVKFNTMLNKLNPPARPYDLKRTEPYLPCDSVSTLPSVKAEVGEALGLALLEELDDVLLDYLCYRRLFLAGH